MFDSAKYDSSFYQKVIDNYNLGKKYDINKWIWDYTLDKKSIKKIIESKDCQTIQDFNREIWDYFSKFAKEYSYNIIWGAFGLEARNPEKPEIRYFDGLVFYLIKDEFGECIKNQDISHFMSCLIHFGYFNLDFNIKD